ncbi:hypothetical protein [Microcoleus sp. herbarium12]
MDWRRSLSDRGIAYNDRDTETIINAIVPKVDKKSMKSRLLYRYRL